MGRRLGFLAGYSLGQVSHMVQLAISQKKLLGYLNGAVVPYARSGSMVKDQSAASRQPCASAPRAPWGGDLVQWDHLRTCLKELMNHMPIDSSMPLSNIKRLFRSRFHMELSETALGHAKLSELLNDPRLQDICFVKLQGHGYVVVHPHQRGRTICLSSSLVRMTSFPGIQEEGTLEVSFADVVEAREPSPDRAEPRKYKIRNTFIHVDDELGATTPCARVAPKRSQTAPTTIGSDLDDEEDQEEPLPAESCAAGSPGDGGCDSCSTGTASETGFPVDASDETLGSWHDSTVAGEAVEATPETKQAPLEPMYLMAVMQEESSGVESPVQTESPVLPSEALARASSAPASSPPGGLKHPSLTPRMFAIQNTFIHIKPEPETPWVSACRKAKTTTHALSSAAEGVGFGM
jgi:hypothetical protein